MLPIKGIQKTTLIDYPGVIASTLFLGGCNFRCPFCHNVPLVKDIDKLPTIPTDEMVTYLESRRKYIDGICITGGEPLLYPEIKEFLQKLKGMDYKIKLDTNGTNPSLLKDLIDNNLVDFVAMDIKASPDRYRAAAGVPVDMAQINASVSLLKEGRVPYEFRTTVVPRFFPQEDVPTIGAWLQGADTYYLQQFEKSAGTLDAAFQEEVVYSIAELKKMAQELERYIKKVDVRS